MGQAKYFEFGPVAMSNTLTTNILNPAITSLSGPVGFTATQPVVKLKRITVVNKTAGAVTFSLWKGATGANAAGTELLGIGKSVPANDSLTFYGEWSLTSTQFLVGGASAATSLTIEGSGEITFA